MAMKLACDVYGTTKDVRVVRAAIETYAAADAEAIIGARLYNKALTPPQALCIHTWARALSPRAQRRLFRAIDRILGPADTAKPESLS